MTLLPWLMFKYFYSLGLTPAAEKMAWHFDVPIWLWKRGIYSPSHSIFWIFVITVVLFSFKWMFHDKNGRALLGLFLSIFSAIIFVYGYTEAFIYLKEGFAVNRSMLQFYGIAVVVCMYAIWKGAISATDAEKRNE